MHVLTDENGNPIPHGSHEHSECGHCHEHEDHEHCHEHEQGHCHAHHHHEAADPQQQMSALLDYMLKHNQHHAAELDQLSQKLRAQGKGNVADQILKAVEEFEKGNLYLSLALSMVKE